MKRRHLCGILLGTLVGLLYPAATAADPGMVAAVPNGSGIGEYDNAWLVTVHFNDGRVDERGIASDHVRFRVIGGRRYLTRIEGTTSVLGKPDAKPTSNFSMTFNVFDPVSMLPARGEISSSAGDATIRIFDGRHVTTRYRGTAGAAEQTAEQDLAKPVFDVHGGMTGLLLAALPLRQGYRTALPGLNDDTVDSTPVEVVGRDTIAQKSGQQVTCWKIAVGPGATRSTYWISKQAPYVIRVVVRASNATATWDMI